MRVNIVKSKSSELVYIIKSFRHNGKNTSKIIRKLGKMDSLLPLHNNSREQVLAWAKQQADILTEEEKVDNNDIIVKYSQSKQLSINKQSTFNGGYLFIQDVFYQLGLHTICKTISDKYKFDFDLNAILSRLVYTRILYPSSKLSSFDSSSNFIELPTFELHHIYRALDILASEKDYIESQVYKNSLNIMKRDTTVLYYDCTNYYFELEQEDGLKQYGKSKENRPNPIVQMGLFMDSNGLPLAFCLSPGNQNEQKTLKPIEERILKDYSLSKFIVCTDAGLASKENRIYNNVSNRSYIVTQSIKQLKGHLKEWALEPTGWHLKGSDKTIDLSTLDDNDCVHQIYYKERWINENGLEQRLIVSYAPKYKIYQRNIREKQIQRAQKMVDSKTKSSHKNANSPSRFITETNCTQYGEVAEEKTLSLNINSIKEEEKYDGFYAVCTTLEDSVEKIVEINKNRWEIEESFRIMKTEFRTRPVYLNKDNRIEAHFTTCFLSLLIYRLLEKRIKEKYSTDKIITTLQNMNFQEVKGEGYIPLYTRTEITDDLHEAFGFRTDYQIVGKNKMKEIIKSTKSQK